MHIEFIKTRLLERPNSLALVSKDSTFTNSDVSGRIVHWESELEKHQILSGSVVGICGDYSFNSISLLLALVNRGCIIVPQNALNSQLVKEKNSLAEVEYVFQINDEDKVVFFKNDINSQHPLYLKLRDLSHPGLVLFSSGSSGVPKAAVHDFIPLLEKFRIKRKPLVTLNFLLFDHWGGLNTLLGTLSSGGSTVTVDRRSPEEVCRLIEKYKVELLPATPSFLNLLILSNAYRNYVLSSLKLITYGAEPMPESTLNKLVKIFTDVKIQQTYGLIEVGVLRSKSLDNDSLWVKLGGENCSVRVVDGLLEIKTPSMILGYLNAPSPITLDGWFMTGDSVEVSGEYFKILGRKSELINIGGEKVYPAEIESLILEMDNVADVTIYPEKNPIMGNIICASIVLISPEDEKQFELRLKKYCLDKLDRYKVPVKINILSANLYSDRFKKTRSGLSEVNRNG
jgi:acyl-CoA synthetase (AMP-forming)/AMP-acid ligase II